MAGARYYVFFASGDGGGHRWGSRVAARGYREVSIMQQDAEATEQRGDSDGPQAG